MHAVIGPPVFLCRTSSMHTRYHAAACQREVHVISFPRPTGKCVIPFLLLSINDLINITLYHSTIAVPRLNCQNKSQQIKTIVFYNMVRALIVIFGEHVASRYRRRSVISHHQNIFF